MKNKGWFGLVLFSLFVLISCSQEAEVPDGFYTFDTDKVNEAVDQASFNPDIPDFVPIPVEFIIYDVYQLAGKNGEALDISFYSRQNDFFTYQVSEGTFETSLEAEDVKINGTIEASYSDDGFAKRLVWANNGLSYKLEYRPNLISNDGPSRDICKEEMIEVAHSTLS